MAIRKDDDSFVRLHGATRRVERPDGSVEEEQLSPEQAVTALREEIGVPLSDPDVRALEAVLARLAGSTRTPWVGRADQQRGMTGCSGPPSSPQRTQLRSPSGTGGALAAGCSLRAGR